MTKVEIPHATTVSNDEWALVYDWQCPTCSLYCRLLCNKEPSNQLHLVNARDNPEIMQEITAQGLDIDQGMVLKINHQIYFGASAIHKLALISRPSTVFNRVNIWMFGSRRRAELIYPALRGCRNFLLKLLRRPKINNLGLLNNERF